MTQSLLRLPADCVRGAIAHLPAAAWLSGPTGGKQVIGLGRFSRFLAIQRQGEHWCGPVWGTTAAQIPSGTVCLMLERAAGVTVLLPVVADGVAATLVGAADGVRVETLADGAGSWLMATGEGSDASAVIDALVGATAERTRTFHPRQAKPQPAWIDRFGWCTWDSFTPYRNVSAIGLRDGLKAFAKAGLVPPLVILDDGWQDTDPVLPDWGGRLQGPGTQPARFPDGLAPVVADARARGVEIFGVWHTLEGYWEGPVAGTAWADSYGVVASPNGSASKGGGPAMPCGAIPPAHIARFFHDYHRRLSDAGVDLVKVDNQASLPRHLRGIAPPITSTRTYQEALQGSVAMHLDGNLLTCMGMAGEVFFNLKLGTVVRNSTDYGPHDAACHVPHLVKNAYNALWSAAFAIPDWDCFWSGHALGAWHAAARALSGGPVYVSDVPGRFDREVIQQLVTARGRVLRPDRPARPVASELFCDPQHSGRALTIHTVCAGIGSVGLFHCGQDAQPVTGHIALDQVPEFDGATAMARLYQAGTIQRLGRRGQISVTLPQHGYEIATLAPIRSGVAVFGSLDHFHAAGHVAAHTVSSDQHTITLRNGGRIGVWCARAPSAVRCAGRAVPARQRSYDAATGLLTLNLAGDGVATVQLTLAH